MSQYKNIIIDQEFDLTLEDIDQMLLDEAFIQEQTCDCGTYKTYGKQDSKHHSDWCSYHLNKGEEE